MPIGSLNNQLEIIFFRCKKSRLMRGSEFGDNLILKYFSNWKITTVIRAHTWDIEYGDKWKWWIATKNIIVTFLNI